MLRPTAPSAPRRLATAPYLGELRASDLWISAGVALLGVVELASFAPTGWGYGMVIEVVAATLLVWRRALPLVVCPAASAALLLMPWVGPQLNDVATPILFVFLICYTLGRWVEDLRGIAGIALLMALFLVDYLAVDLRSHDVTDLVFVTVLVVPPYVFGRISRKLAVQSELLLRHQEQAKAEALRAERHRIARDLHDVIAHSVSAMVVQTAAAQDLVHTDPDRTEGLLADVADTGRQALSETGRLLHVLRDDADELGLRPAPGLSELPDLVEEFRERGLEVRADLPDPVPVVPPGVDVAAYRIAQEVLTNALRYATDRSVVLRVRATRDQLAIDAANASDGRSGLGSGLGLLGIAERVTVHGGSLTHRTVGGRFELEAVIPADGGAVP